MVGAVTRLLATNWPSLRRWLVVMLLILVPWTPLLAQETWRNWLPLEADRFSGIFAIMAVEVGDHPLLQAIAAGDMVRLGDEGPEFMLLARYVGIRFQLGRAEASLGISKHSAPGIILHLYSQWRLRGSCVFDGKEVDVGALFPAQDLTKPIPIPNLDSPVETFGPQPSQP